MHRLSQKAIMRAELFMNFCIKNYIGTQGEDLSTVKVLCPPPVVMLPTVLRRWSWCWVYFVWLCVFTMGRFLLSLALLFVLVVLHCDHLVWGRESELIYVLLMHLFVYFARVHVCLLPLPLGARGWLRPLILALHGLFC